MSAPMVEPADAAKRQKEGALLLDVREPFERKLASIEGALHIPMRDLQGRLAELPKDRPILVVCHHGMRSQTVADWLIGRGYEAINVAGGIDAWADSVDPTIPHY